MDNSNVSDDLLRSKLETINLLWLKWKLAEQAAKDTRDRMASQLSACENTRAAAELAYVEAFQQIQSEIDGES